MTSLLLSKITSLVLDASVVTQIDALKAKGLGDGLTIIFDALDFYRDFARQTQINKCEVKTTIDGDGPAYAFYADAMPQTGKSKYYGFKITPKQMSHWGEILNLTLKHKVRTVEDAVSNAVKFYTWLQEQREQGTQLYLCESETAKIKSLKPYDFFNPKAPPRPNPKLKPPSAEVPVYN